MAQAAFGGVLLAGELVSMVKTLTASARNLSPCWPGHLQGTRRLWQGEELCPQAALGPPLVLLAPQRDLSLSH